MDKIKVSVILPVYGVAQYIEKCTQSLLDQTLQEMEFIFVDDHGPDNSIELVQKMIENHPRKTQFVFLKPEHNMGAGMARNFAIPQAKGEYIAFVDSDDWILSTMFEELYQKASEFDSDLCCCQMQKVYPDGSIGDILENPYVGDGLLTPSKRAFILSNYVSLFASFIYKRDFLINNEIQFAPDRSADDSYMVSCAWMMAQSISYVNKPFYQYLIRPGSVCTTKDSTKYVKRIAVFNRLMQYAKEHGVYADFKSEIDFMYIKKGYVSSVTNYIINSTEPKPKVFEEIHQSLLEQIPDYKCNKYYQNKKSVQLLVWLIRHLPFIAVPVIRMWVKKNNIVS